MNILFKKYKIYRTEIEEVRLFFSSPGDRQIWTETASVASPWICSNFLIVSKDSSLDRGIR